MKKILYLLLLIPSFLMAQAEFEKITTTEAVENNNASRVIVQDATTGENQWVKKTSVGTVLSTGLVKNGLLSINADPTKYNLTAGTIIVSDFSNPDNITTQKIDFPAVIGKTPSFLTTSIITYVGVNLSGVIVEQATPFTPTQRRSIASIGAIIHSNLATINVINGIASPSNDVGNSLFDFMDEIGALNSTGNVYSANGANLTLNKSAGSIFKRGSNFQNDILNPHYITQSAGTSLTFRYRTQTGVEGSDRINIDPDLYDVAGVLTAVPNNKWTIQTVYIFQSGVTRIQYGQNLYNSLSEARNALPTRTYVEESNNRTQGVKRCFIIVMKGETALNTFTTDRFNEAQKFGGTSSGGVSLTDTAIIASLGYTPENLANKQNSLVADGTGVKYATVDAVNNNVILKNSTPQTKVGGFTSGGVSLTKSNDNWIALGTSVTQQALYATPMASQLNLILNNFGVAGSNSNDLVNQYVNIPTLNSGNQDTYRLLSIEHGINDAAQNISLATFRTNLVNVILNAKSKGWSNEKILVINGNYCSRADLIISQPAYANEAILVSKEQGVQYSDIYNYTKNNGGGSLLSDQVHPTASGGIVYARGVIASMQGGGEFSNALTVINGLVVGGVNSNKEITSQGNITTLGSLKTGNGINNNPTSTINGDVIVPLNAGLISQHSQNGLLSKLTPLEDFGSGNLGASIRNYAEGGSIRLYTAGSVRGSQNLALDLTANGLADFKKGMISRESLVVGGTDNLGKLFRVVGSADISSITLSDTSVSGVPLNIGGGANSGWLAQSAGSPTSRVLLRGYSNTTQTIQLDPVAFSYINSNNIGLGTSSNNGIDRLQNNGSQTNTGQIKSTLATGTAPLVIASTTLVPNLNVERLNGQTGLFYAPIESPSLTGTPTAPTAATNDYSTTIANTTFVQNVATGKANLFSPGFSGTPTAPTATAGTNTTQIATTAFVTDAVSTSSKWTASGSDIYNSNIGNVGVGTTTPITGKLVVSDANLAGSGSLAGSALDISQTWNTTGNPSALKLNVTNTASGANAFLSDFQLGGVSQFRIEKNQARSLKGLALGTPLGFGGIFPDAVTGNEIVIRSNTPQTTTNVSDILLSNVQGDLAITSGIRNLVSVTRGFNVSSGNGVYNIYSITPVINQTGTASGITRGIYVNPTLTSATDFRAIELTNNSGKGIWQTGSAINSFKGRTLINTTTDNLTDNLQVAGSGSFFNSSSNPTIKSSNISSGSSFLSDKFAGASGNHFEAQSSSSTVFSVGLTGNITANTYTGGATLTGTPTAPTATTGTNTTQIATTAFVQGIRPYKVYTALLSQSGTNAPTAIVLENTLGGTVIWSYVSTGQYNATLTGAFTTNKTAILPFETTSNVGKGNSTQLDNDIIRFTTVDITGSSINTVISSEYIEIRVYN